MKKKFPSLPFISSLLFIFFLFLGFRLAVNKPVWNDEIYSQFASVERISSGKILQGKIGEGNNAPLYYLTQKLTVALLQYELPYIWQEGTKIWGFDRVWDRMFMRVVAVVCVSLMIVLIFYYFVKFYSWGSGLFAIFLSLSTAMVWSYWAEARPYALWMLLTTLQVLLFLRIVHEQGDRVKLLNWLAAVNIFLSFTVILSLPQIAVISFFLWIYGIRDQKRYIFLLILPVLVGLAYYWTSPKYPFGLIFTVEQYLRANVSRDRWHLVIIFCFFSMLTMLPEKLNIRRWLDRSVLQGIPILWILLAMTAASCAVLAVFKIKQETYVQFPVTEKYFIYLAPIGIIATTMFTDRLVRAVKNRWAAALLICGIAALVVPRFLKVITDVNRQYPNFFF